MSFESILRDIHEETDRDSLAILAGKYPSLREYADIGSKYADLAPRLRRLGGDQAGERFATDPEAPVKLAEAWQEWRDTNWDPDAKMTRAERRKQELLDAAEQKITELEARSDTDMSPEEIRAMAREVANEALKNNGGITAEQLQAKLDKEIIPKLQSDFNNTLLNFEEVFDQLGPLVVEHKAEFGESLSAKKVFERMRESAKIGKFITASEAYRDVYGDKISAKSAEARQKELAEAEHRGELKAAKRFAEENAGRSMPVGASEGKRMGPVQRRLQEKMKNQQTGEAKLGTGAIAAQAAQDRREKQFASMNQ